MGADRPIHTGSCNLHLLFSRPPWSPFPIGCRFRSRPKPGEQASRSEAWGGWPCTDPKKDCLDDLGISQVATAWKGSSPCSQKQGVSHVSSQACSSSLHSVNQ